MITVVSVFDLEASEVRTFSHDWSDNVVSPATVLSVDVSAIDLLTGLDATGDAVVGDNTAGSVTTITLQKLSAKGGTAYDLKLKMTRTDGEVYIDHYLLLADIDKTVYGMIDRALRLLGVRNIGTNLTQEEQEQGLEALNTMLLSWSSEKMLVQSEQIDNFTAVIGQSDYSMGPGGDVPTARPQSFTGGFVMDANMFSTPLDPISLEAAADIPYKLTAGRPNCFVYDDAYPLGSVFLYPVPDADYAIVLMSIKEMANYSTVAINHGLEGDYENSVSYNLAIHLAPKYGVTASPEVIAVGAQSVSRLINERYGKLDPTLDAGLLVV